MTNEVHQAPASPTQRPLEGGHLDKDLWDWLLSSISKEFNWIGVKPSGYLQVFSQSKCKVCA